MKIMIAEPIQTLEYLRDSGVFPFNSKEGVLYTVGSINIAIDTMRKYQKIQEIMDSRADDDAKSNSKALGEIEVIMYGDNG